MNATVKLVNPARSMYAAEMEEGGFVIFEFVDCAEPQLGDVISHADFYSMGAEIYRNSTQNLKFAVYVQNVVGSLQQAQRQCFLR